MKKFVFFIFGIIFSSFAFMQLNDVDPAKWITIYLFTGILPIVLLYWNNAKYGIYILLAVLISMFVLNIPDFFNWAKSGFPSITESMKAEKLHVEQVREFLGICICLFYLGAV